MIIDGDKLKNDLMDYYGSATPFYHAAFLDVSRVENATPEELVNIAISNNIDLSEYELNGSVKSKKKSH